MVLVDTSVWISFLGNYEPFAVVMERLLWKEQVAGHELVYGELLIGDRGGRLKLLESYRQMQQVPGVPHNEVATFVRDRTLHGTGVGWIDVHLLASALVSKLPFWTIDHRCEKLAKHLGVAYDAFGLNA